jgi:two-component system, chemotaxis family, protein-glutamate methylesterase/glutaminase
MPIRSQPVASREGISAPRRRIKVVVVDDSALARQLISRLLKSDPEIEVVGIASDPYSARNIIKATNPDVVTLDVEMPNMDGISFLEKIMRLRPMPVVMVSSLTLRGAEITLQALELGAVDFVTKPSLDVERGLDTKRDELVAKVKAASQARIKPLGAPQAAAVAVPLPVRSGPLRGTDSIVAIGSSTGGVDALRQIVCALPPDTPAVLITQHMPAGFTARFAERLDGLSQVRVRQAEDGQRVLPGHVYIAPGDKHLRLARSGAQYHCRLGDDPPVGGHKPSVDVLFQSVATVAGGKSVGVILTGMGRDGASGLKAMREAGARTLGQDEQSCVVYGMPKAAFNDGAVEQEFSIQQMAAAILDRVQSLA